MSEESLSPCGISPARVLEEVGRISASPDFARAPVMRRLLDFLVRETLAGRGDQLKAYAVAVDGLGRPEDFDAQADSYPRVQVGRLRRMLDAFYARDGGIAGLRLSIPAGRYRVLIAEIEEEGPRPAEGDGRPAHRWFYGPAGALAVLGVLIVIGVLVWLLLSAMAAKRESAGATAPIEAPILRLDHLRAPAELDSVELDADGILLDGLRRSWLIRVRNGPAARDADPTIAPAHYLLGGEILGARSPTLRLRLVRKATGEMVWSGETTLPAERELLGDRLAPLIAELIQPYGVIATDQRALAGGRVAPGYPCILKFDQYRRDRSAPRYAEMKRCVERTLALDPGHALALAASSFLALDAELYGFAPAAPDARAQSFALARRAAAADPYSSMTQLALARATSFTGNCSSAVRSGRRALALNPNDPDLHSTVGVLLFNCGDAQAEEVVRRALALDPSPPSSFYTPLVFIALDRGDIAAARHHAEQMMPAPPPLAAFYELAMAVMAAADGDIAGARAAWARIERADPQVARDPDALLARWMVPERVRMKSMAHLRRAGIIPPAPRAAAPA